MRSGRDISGVRVLVVDDDTLCMETVEAILMNAGAEVLRAEDAEQALQVFSREHPDAIISDIKLPCMDGIELLRHIRAKDREVPVILVTGFASVGSAVEALKLGAQDYLLKPVENPEKLVNAIWQAVDHCRLTATARLLQSELKESEETFRTLFNSGTDAMFLYPLSASGVPEGLSEVNRAASALLDCGKKNLSAMTILDLLAPEFRDATARIVKSLVRRKSASCETFLIDRKGGKVPVEMDSHSIMLRGRRMVLSIARDISQRREIERRVAEASEREKQELGRDLHDVLCQDLASIDMLASLLQASLRRENSKSVDDAGMVRELAVRSVAMVRRMAAGLFPSDLEVEGLGAALETLASQEERMHRIPCTFSSSGRFDFADKVVPLNLYRIAQEALSNAARHSGANRIWISLDKDRRGGRLVVRDNGKGMAKGVEESGGLGLKIMRYRATMIGGVLDISSNPGGGTKVSCVWR